MCEVYSRGFRRESDKKSHKCVAERQKPVCDERGSVYSASSIKGGCGAKGNELSTEGPCRIKPLVLLRKFAKTCCPCMLAIASMIIYLYSTGQDRWYVCVCSLFMLVKIYIASIAY